MSKLDILANWVLVLKIIKINSYRNTIQCNWYCMPWWRRQMETFSALLALCAGNSLVTSEFPSQRPVVQTFGIFFDLHLNKRLNKQSSGWWFEMPSRSLWRHCNVALQWQTWNRTRNSQKSSHNLAHTDELWGAYCEHFRESWLRYSKTAVFN